MCVGGGGGGRHICWGGGRNWRFFLVGKLGIYFGVFFGRNLNGRGGVMEFGGGYISENFFAHKPELWHDA